MTRWAITKQELLEEFALGTRDFSEADLEGAQLVGARLRSVRREFQS